MSKPHVLKQCTKVDGACRNEGQGSGVHRTHYDNELLKEHVECSMRVLLEGASPAHSGAEQDISFL